MSDYTTKATVELDVNGQSAKAELQKQIQLVRQLQESFAKVSATGDKKAIKAVSKELSAARKELRLMQSNTQSVEQTLKNLDKATPNELRQSLRRLTKELNSMQRGTSVWNEQVEKIKQVKTELDAVTTSVANQQTAWQKTTSFVQKWQVSLFNIFNQLKELFSKGMEYVNVYADMEEEMAGVRKFTGLSSEAVAELNEAFKAMDTRTSREELNRLAQEAGRLGKTSVEDVLGFVRAADQINVALDDLGSDATLTLSKLTGIFGDEERLGTEKSLLAVGSVINELSQNCSASAPFLADFASRMGGVGAQANMTIPQIMSFAAVLDSNKQNLESSATALSQFITRLYQEPAKYATAAGLEVSTFTTLLKEDANAAVITLLESFNKLGGMDSLAPLFKDLGENGSGAISTLSTLSANIDAVKSQQKVANEAFREATSVTNEANIANSTVKAGLEKTKKQFHELAVELGEQLAPTMQFAMTSTGALAKALATVASFLIANKGIILSLLATWAALAVAINAATIKLTLHYAWLVVTQKGMMLLQGAGMLLRMAFFALTGQIHKAKSAYIAFSMLTKVSPFGILIAAITGVVVGLLTMTKRMNAAQKAQKALSDISKDAAAKLVDEKMRIDLLVQAANNETLSLEERRKVVDKLNSIIPNYNAQLDETTGKYTANKRALDEYLNSLKTKYEIEGAKDQLSQLGKEKAEIEVSRAQINDERETENQIIADASNKGIGSNISTTGTAPGSGGSAATIAAASQRLASLDKKEKNLDRKLWEIERIESAILGKYGNALQASEASSASVSGNDLEEDPELEDPPLYGTPSTPDRFQKEKNEKAMKETLAMMKKASGQSMDEKGNVSLYSAADYKKELAKIEVGHYQEILKREDLTEQERLEIRAKYQEALAKQKDVANAVSLADEDRYHDAEIAKIRQQYLDNILTTEQYNQQLENEEIRHLAAIAEVHKKDAYSTPADGSAPIVVDAEAYDAYVKAYAAYQQKITEIHARKVQEREQNEAEKQTTRDAMRNHLLLDEENSANYTRDLAILDEVYNEELAKCGDNNEKRLALERAYQVAKLALQKQYNQEASLDTENSFKSAINKAAEWLNSDGGKAMTGAMSTLTSGMGEIFSGVSSLIQAELEIQTASINKRYDAEIDKAEGNSYKINKLEKKKNKELAKAKNEANRKQFAMQILQAVAQTAQNAIAAYGSAAAIPLVGFIMAPIAASMAVAAGMIQIAALKKQQKASEAQGYSKGGFTGIGGVLEPAGIVHKGEWVASQKLVNNPQTRPLIDALDYAQRTNTVGALRAADVSRSITAPVYAQSLVESSAPTQSVANENISALNDTQRSLADSITRLNARLNEPFVTVNTVTGDAGIKKAQDDYDRLLKNKTSKSNRAAL